MDQPPVYFRGNKNYVQWIGGVLMVILVVVHAERWGLDCTTEGRFDCLAGACVRDG